MVTNLANIAIANKWDVTYGLSINIFTFDIDLFYRSTWLLDGCLAKYFGLFVFIGKMPQVGNLVYPNI